MIEFENFMLELWQKNKLGKEKQNMSNILSWNQWIWYCIDQHRLYLLQLKK